MGMMQIEDRAQASPFRSAATLGERVLFENRDLRVAEETWRHRGPDDVREERAATHRLVFTRRGCSVWHHEAHLRRRLVADPLSVVLLNPDDRYRVKHPASAEHASTVLALSANAASDAMARAGASLVVSPRFSAHRAMLTAPALLRFHRIRQACGVLGAAALIDDASITDAVFDLLRDVLDAQSSSPENSRRARSRAPRGHRDLSEATRLLLASAPGEPHRLDDLAQALNVSMFHLAHTFRAETGLPVHRYLLNLRLATALGRLGNARANLSTLGLELGFSSHSHFTSAFTRHLGVSPAIARSNLVAQRRPRAAGQ